MINPQGNSLPLNHDVLGAQIKSIRDKANRQKMQHMKVFNGYDARSYPLRPYQEFMNEYRKVNRRNNVKKDSLNVSCPFV